MNNFYINNFINSNAFFIIIIFIFSFFINFYYAKFGVFPIDTFFHYDPAYRILNNEYPIRDSWVVSGLVIDIFQSFFFKVFGVNWKSYIYHSSLFNFIISIFIYFYFINLRLSKIKSLFFTLCFSLLAYTISGTPFVDHHATFFLLISSLLLIKYLNNEQNYLWFFIILLFFLSFFTKQVPATYVIFSHGLIMLYTLLSNKKFNVIRLIFLNLFFFIIIILALLLFYKIDFKNFYVQYFDYPQSIGSIRFNNFNLSFNSFFNLYKFLIIPLIFVIILKIKNYPIKKDKNNLVSFFILISYIFCIIFHQIMTKNQIYIYFTIPILFAVLDSEIYVSKYNHKKIFSFLMIIFLVFVTLKYHYRFNVERKFHELQKVNFNESINGNKIDKSLDGLLWINPFFKGKPDEEVAILKEGKLFLEKRSSEVMLISHYLFLDSITIKKLNLPNRSFTMDGVSMPIKGNKHFNFYKKFLIDKIEKNKIKEIYFFKHEGISRRAITDYLNPKCYNLEENTVFSIYKILC